MNDLDKKVLASLTRETAAEMVSDITELVTKALGDLMDYRPAAGQTAADAGPAMAARALQIVVETTTDILLAVDKHYEGAQQ